MDPHVPCILGCRHTPQEGFLLFHLPVAVKDDLFQGAGRQTTQHMGRHPILNLPAYPLNIIIDAHHVGARRKEFHDEVARVFVSQHGHLDPHLLPFAPRQGCTVVLPLGFVGHEKCDPRGWYPLSGEHSQRVHQDEGCLAFLEPSLVAHVAHGHPSLIGWNHQLIGHRLGFRGQVWRLSRRRMQVLHFHLLHCYQFFFPFLQLFIITVLIICGLFFTLFILAGLASVQTRSTQRCDALPLHGASWSPLHRLP
mmetsp:Transcript_39300/g.84635  ORF Transcript_39300/g.84635 Transcript_39300/m.84635 type:complete len:252 (-) Transcript_39300:118-873(-)